MGDPEFKLRDLIKRENIRVFSSNYALYGDMSRRLYQVLQRFAPRVEPYSIDEMFLDLEGLDLDLVTTAATSAPPCCRRRRSLPASASARRRRKRSWPTSSRRRGRNSPASAICATRSPAPASIPPSRSAKYGASASLERLSALGLDDQCRL